MAIRSAEALNIYSWFKIGDSGLAVSLFQYADDAMMENLWTILRCFELASSLRVNFAKSIVMGANVSSSFLVLAESFLHCRVGSLPFIYLGLLVGAHRKSTGEALIDLY